MKEPQQTRLKRSLPTNIPTSEFCNHFRLVVANTTTLQEEVYKIRYKVYCQELNYENQEKCPDGMEQDIYDAKSIHCLLRHRASGFYVGCVRLVLPAAYSAETKFPCERILGSSWRSGSCELRNLSLQSIGEVSRLAVTAQFRKHQEAVSSNFSEEERHCFPLIPLGLYLAATSVALEIELNSVVALMEPRLSRHLARFGIHFHQIGGLVEFHGQRGLYQISKETVLDGMETSIENLFQRFRAEVNKSLKNCPTILRVA